MFTPISCVPTGVQPGNLRFPNPQSRPFIKDWRCDLTALSHTYNLYFLACIDAIHVYQPSFPDQSLPAEPELVLHPPVSPGPLRPEIDHSNPHSVTRLHVDFLGREEIVLITCDDGDVIGYRMRDIYRAIKRRRDSSDTKDWPADNVDVRVFLHRNVGRSAWGLAVHRDARLIAISSNTHNIVVLAYALTNASASESDDPVLAERTFLYEEGETDFPYPRQRDHVITLYATANIPAVSFDNSGLDPSGRWLFSSSIDGVNRLWDLHHPMAPARIFQIGTCTGAKSNRVPFGAIRCACPNRQFVLHAAWGAIFIDPRSCHECDDFDEALGWGFVPPKRIDDDCLFWDNTDYSLLRGYNKKRSPFAEFGSPNEDSFIETSDAMSLLNAEGEDEYEEQQSVVDLTTNSDYSTGVVNMDEAQEELTVGNEQAQNAQPQPPPDDTLFLPEGAPQVVLATWLNEVFESDGDSSDESLSPEDLLSVVETGSIAVSSETRRGKRQGRALKRPYCSLWTSDTFLDQPQPPRPCVLVTKTEIYLYQQPFDRAGDFKDPIMSMQNPLYPQEDRDRGLANYHARTAHRQCFVQQVPELGIMVIASPAGRAGIFSLTKAREAGRTLYGFRLDHLLPFKKDAGGRNELAEAGDKRLVGVAVGPVQGMLDPAESDEDVRKTEQSGLGSRRWRLLMMYQDNTLYSFELGKYRETEPPGVGDLTV